jgi:hypothetical protein
MKTRYFTLIALALALILAAMPAMAQAPASAPLPALFPLEVGNQWQFETEDGRHSFTISVGIPEIHNDRPYFSVAGYGYGSKREKLLVRQAEDGSLHTLDEATGQDALLTSFTHVPGGAFDSRLGTCEEMGRVDAAPVPWHYGAESVAAAVAIRYQTIGCADLGLGEELYVENLGLVRRTMNTMIGPLDFRLVYARVGKLVYRTGASSTLSLDLDRTHVARAPGERQPPVRITMRYAIEPLTAGSLRFRSGQLYDFFLVDSNGNEVWRYSDQEGFIQPIMEIPFAGVIEFTGYLPGHRFPDGNYMLYGWMNTDSQRQPTVGIPFQISSVQPAGLSIRTPVGKEPRATEAH